jgi:hypothetical protein
LKKSKATLGSPLFFRHLPRSSGGRQSPAQDSRFESPPLEIEDLLSELPDTKGRNDESDERNILACHEVFALERLRREEVRMYP